jgi:hypothetical protein
MEFPHKIFEIAEDVYKDEEKPDFYVTDGSIGGIRFAALPERSNVKFSAYVLSDISDVKKVVDYHVRGITKAFYCALCAIEEADNVVEEIRCAVSQSTKTVLTRNYARDINWGYTPPSGVDMLICGTSPRYVHAQMLLMSRAHHQTYTVFNDISLFKSFAETMEYICRYNEDAKAVFNGNTGSDRWHFHVHLTDQRMSYTEGETISETGHTVSSRFADAVNYLLISSPDLETLFGIVSHYASVYYRPEYSETEELYMSMMMNVKYKAGTPVYIFRLFHGVKHALRSGQILIPAAGMCIIPATEEYKSGTFEKSPVDPRVLVQRLVDTGAYHTWDLGQFTRTSIDTNRLIPEVFEYRLRTISCDDMGNEDGLNYVRSVVNSLGDCVITSTCNNIGSAYYKLVISAYVGCKIRNTIAQGHTYSHTRDYIAIYDHILSTLGPVVVYSGVAYAVNTYGLKQKMDRLFLRGNFIQLLFQKTTDDLFVISAWGDSKYIDAALSPMKVTGPVDVSSAKINSWLQLGGVMGDPSATGEIHRSSIRAESAFEFVIKIDKNPVTSFNNAMFMHEFLVGLTMNEYRAQLPNYVLTLGSFKCRSVADWANVFTGLCNAEGDNQVAKRSFIALEMVKGETLQSYIRNHMNDEVDVMKAIYQTAIALMYGQKYRNFTHYDFHTGNVMVTDITPSVYSYRLFDADEYEYFTFDTSVNCTIIDYGSTHVDGLNDNYAPSPEFNRRYGFDNKPALNRDIYSMIMHACFVMCTYSTGPSIRLMFARYSLFVILKSLMRAYGNHFVEHAHQKLMEDASNVPMDRNRERAMIEVFNKAAKGRYYLYLPVDTPAPEGPFSDALSFARYLKLNAFQNDTANEQLQVYKWGDYHNGAYTGCVTTQPIMDVRKVETLKNWFSEK